MIFKALLVICFLHLACTYDEKFDRIEIEQIVRDDVVHKSINQCILGEVDCGSYWEEVKAIAPEIARDHCAHCTPRQKVIIRTYVNATKVNYPETWKKISNMYKKQIK